MVMLKANGYGLGAVRLAKLYEERGCDFFAIACIEEGIELREAGIRGDVMIMGYTEACYAELLADYDLTQSLVSLDYARQLSLKASRLRKTIKTQIQLDTGMSRVGIFSQGESFLETAVSQCCEICGLPGLDVKGIYTHMAVADDLSREAYTQWQLDSYTYIAGAVIARTGKHILRHIAASPSILYQPETYRGYDYVRPGVVLYGAAPHNRPYNENDGIGMQLKDAYSLRSRVAMVKDVPAGTGVSYDLLYTTNRPTRIATVSVGYGDAYLRAFAVPGVYAVIRGKKCPQIGKICMDMTMFDVTGTDVEVDDEVILLGYGGIPINELGLLTGVTAVTVPCLVPNRDPHVYINE